MEIIIQILSTVALVLGIATAEVLATRALGNLKKSWLYIIEIVLFVFIVIVIFNTITLTEFSDTLFVAIYFFIGFLTILFVRSLIGGFGFLGEQVKKKALRIKDEKDFIIGLKKALERRKFKEEGIKRIAKEVGFSKKKVDDVFKFWEK